MLSVALWFREALTLEESVLLEVTSELLLTLVWLSVPRLYPLSVAVTPVD